MKWKLIFFLWKNLFFYYPIWNWRWLDSLWLKSFESSLKEQLFFWYMRLVEAIKGYCCLIYYRLWMFNLDFNLFIAFFLWKGLWPWIYDIFQYKKRYPVESFYFLSSETKINFDWILNANLLLKQKKSKNIDGLKNE